MNTLIKVEGLSKQYRLGVVGTGTMRDDLIKWWSALRGKENPLLKLGESNDRTQTGNSNYVWSLKDINFEVNQGDVLGIIGRNGAGKSTLLKVLSRITAPTTGSIKIKGRVASLLEVGTGFHPELTGRENIYLNGAILGMKKAEITRKMDEIIAFSSVERYVDTPVKRYSSGMYVRLAFAVAAHLDPEILILDEVLAVGDTEFQNKCLGKIKDISTQGRTVLFVSHNMGSIQNLCNRGLLLNNGEVVFDGKANDAVSEYVARAINFNSANFIEIQPEHHSSGTLNEIQVISIELLEAFQYNQYATNDEMNVELTLFGNQSIDNFRIAFGIYTIQEEGVAAHFTDPKFSIKKGESKKIKLKINNHQLAKGQYYFNFAIGKGNEETGVREFDIVMKTLFFEIAYTDKDHSKGIMMWDQQGWGKINFQNVVASEVG
jgi:lipopolysaccharide transport system ATP-binding protein